MTGSRIRARASRSAPAGRSRRWPFNDVAVVRDGTGQVIIEIRIDDALYAGTAGDELDGRELGTAPLEATIGLWPDYATMITLAGQETMLAGLRRRGLVVDSPRILAHHLGAAPHGG